MGHGRLTTAGYRYAVPLYVGTATAKEGKSERDVASLEHCTLVG